MPGLISHVCDIEIKYTQIFINNEWQKAVNGKTFPVINPSTGEEICRVEEGTKVSIYANTFYDYFVLFFIGRYR
jgi:hypothetical protein